jgi:hypothetical protein
MRRTTITAVTPSAVSVRPAMIAHAGTGVARLR